MSQTAPVAQSPLALHAVLDAPVVSQRKGAQDWPGPASPAGIEAVPSAEQVADGAATHLPAVQRNEGAQSEAVVQEARQLVASAQPRLPVHGAGGSQVPAPSQRAFLPSTQPAPHEVLTGGYRQVDVPTPSHLPPHVPPVPTQATRPLRGAPFTAVQVPTAPGSLHASHCPEQGVLQQTPSAHAEPAAHSSSETQAAPRDLRGAHVPPAQ